MLGGVSAVPAHDPEHLCRTRLGQIDRLDDIGTDLALGIAAADRIDQDRILIAEVTGVEPCCKHRIPSLVIGACGELRDVVDGAVGFDPAELAKVIDGVAAIGRAAADADQEQPPPAVPQPVELGRQSLDRGKRNIMTNLRGRSKEGFRVVHPPNRPRTRRNCRELLPHPPRHLKCLVDGTGTRQRGDEPSDS